MVNSKTPAQVVAAARSQAKITTPELIENLFDDFFELHGDRQGADDPAIVGGLARFCGRPLTVVATDKGKTPKQRVAKHFGSPEPAGYRKLLRPALILVVVPKSRGKVKRSRAVCWNLDA